MLQKQSASAILVIQGQMEDHAMSVPSTFSKTQQAVQLAHHVHHSPPLWPAVTMKLTVSVTAATRKWTIKPVIWNVPQALKPGPTNCTVTGVWRTTTKTLPVTMPAPSAPLIPTTTYAIRPALTPASVNGGI